MGTIGLLVLLFLGLLTVGLFLALWLGYQSAEKTRRPDDVVRRLERHVRSENQMVTRFGSGPSVERLHGAARDDPHDQGLDAPGLAAS